MATRRTKSISTKVTEAEYDAIVRRAEPQTVSAWARGILVGAAQPDPLHFLLLAEVRGPQNHRAESALCARREPPALGRRHAPPHRQGRRGEIRQGERADRQTSPSRRFNKPIDQAAFGNFRQVDPTTTWPSTQLAENRASTRERPYDAHARSADTDRSGRAASHQSKGDLHDDRARASCRASCASAGACWFAKTLC